MAVISQLVHTCLLKEFQLGLFLAPCTSLFPGRVPFCSPPHCAVAGRSPPPSPWVNCHMRWTPVWPVLGRADEWLLSAQALLLPSSPSLASFAAAAAARCTRCRFGGGQREQGTHMEVRLHFYTKATPSSLLPADAQGWFLFSASSWRTWEISQCFTQMSHSLVSMATQSHACISKYTHFIICSFLVSRLV